MEDLESHYTINDLEKDFDIFISNSIAPLNEDQQKITAFKDMEDALHDLASYVGTIVQQSLITNQSKYKLIHDRSLDTRLSELLKAYPEHGDTVQDMQAYKTKIDDIIHKTALVFGLALETWE